MSCDKQKPLYLYYKSAYGHQTWQDGNLPWRAPNHKSQMTIWSYGLLEWLGKERVA